MAYKMRALLTGISIFFVSGCDGYYRLVHIPNEGDITADTSIRYTYRDSDGRLSVEIYGGASQSPYTSKVEAGHLWLFMESRCEDSCEYVFWRPYLISGRNTIHPDIFSADYIPLGNEKKMDIVDLRRDEDDNLDEMVFTVGPGHVKSALHYSSYYDTIGLLEFPIAVNMGYIVCGNDTINIEGIKFEASRRIPPGRTK